MTTEEARAGLLDGFLAARGMTREMLLAAVDEPFGRPLVVLATGSILQGVGNSRSDLDINVVVDRDVTRLPIASYTHRFLVDTTYFGVSEVEAWAREVCDQPWPPRESWDRDRWYRHIAALFNCTRFGYGLVLSARDHWNDSIAEFRKPWLPAQVACWWQIEALRRRLAARWLYDSRPLLSAQRILSAIFATLEARAAAAGQFYFAPKWLPEKLRALGDIEGLETMCALMRAPTIDSEVRSYIERCEAALDQLGGAPNDDLRAQLCYLSGVQVRRVDSRTLVSRWDLRSIEVREAQHAIPDPPELVWEGRLDAQLPSHVLSLFAGDMAWLSIVAKAA